MNVAFSQKKMEPFVCAERKKMKELFFLSLSAGKLLKTMTWPAWDMVICPVSASSFSRVSSFPTANDEAEPRRFLYHWQALHRLSWSPYFTVQFDNQIK